MTSQRRRPGVVRDAILNFFATTRAASVDEIHQAVERHLGSSVPRSSVRSYLGLNTPALFERLDRGTYRLKKR